MSQIEINIDSTSLGRSSCILHWYRHVIDGYSQRALNASMVYGIAWHKFADTMYKTSGHYKKAADAAKEIFLRIPTIPDDKKPWLRDVDHMVSTCYNVWSIHVAEDKNFELWAVEDGIPASEMSFRILYFEDEWVKIYLCGTIDGIGKFHNGVFAIRDFKTTSSWDNKGYFKQYELSRQLRIYTIACKMMAAKEPNSVLGRIGQQRMGAFIDAIFLKAKPNDVEFTRSVVYQYEDADLDAFRLTLDDQCRRLSAAVKTGYLPKEGIVTGTCESKWSDGEKGKCDFWNVCKVNSTVAQVLLERDFIRKPFNPLAYNS